MSNVLDGKVALVTGGSRGRYAAPADIAAAVAFLASDDSGYITGATINVDGGFTI